MILLSYDFNSLLMVLLFATKPYLVLQVPDSVYSNYGALKFCFEILSGIFP